MSPGNSDKAVAWFCGSPASGRLLSWFKWCRCYAAVHHRGEAPLPQGMSGATSTRRHGAAVLGAPPLYPARVLRPMTEMALVMSPICQGG